MASRFNNLSPSLANWKIQSPFKKDGVLYLSEITPEQIERISTGDVRDFDVLLASFPRSGSSRLLEICWQLLHGCDISNANSLPPLVDRILYLDWERIPQKIYEAPVIAQTHHNFNTCRSLVERTNMKVIFGLRNPKDVLVSNYHFARMNKSFGLFPGTWHQFMELYQKGETPRGDFFDTVLSWWEQRYRKNILFVTYEDLNENPLPVIRDISRFLGQTYDDDKLMQIVEWCSFSNMRIQPSTNYESFTEKYRIDISPYMRRGQVGDWKNFFSDEENDYIDTLCEVRCKPEKLFFKFEPSQ